MEGVIKINTEKCVGCGLCRDDCVACNIDVIDGKAVLLGTGCILCGHCQAICPNAAVEIEGFEDTVEEYEKQTRLDPDVLLQALKTRRSIRKFKETPVKQEVVNAIIEAGRLTPTGSNKQGTSYVILDKYKDRCEKIAVGLFRDLVKGGDEGIKGYAGNVMEDDHFFFKKAPLVIVIFGESKTSTPLAAQSMALMAESYGLGVLFSGLFTDCVNKNNEIRNIMGLTDEEAVTTLVIGETDIVYHRTVHRKKACVRIC